MNDLHSLIFRDLKQIDVTQKTFVRDLSHRFMRRMVSLARQILPDDPLAVEIGTSPFPEHPLDEIRGHCCSHSTHSTAFLSSFANTVVSVDVTPSVGKQQFDNVIFKKETGTTYLRDYSRKRIKGKRRPIDMLFLHGHHGAEKNLEMFEAAQLAMSDECFLVVTDTDVEDGGAGKLLVPKATEKGYTIVFRGRVTLLVKRESRDS
jgi:hypothetical protein